MDLGPGSIGLGFVAGALSLLSPCVLPLVPIVVGSAAAAHPLGAVALAAGLALSFTAVGLFVATIGFAVGLDAEWFRIVAAVLLVGFGVVLVSATLQSRFAGATSALGAFGGNLLGRIQPEGFAGQLAIGLVLGLVWAPCVGPTLGAASTLASQGTSLGQAALVMAFFGIGAGLPLALFGFGSRGVLARHRDRMLTLGTLGKRVLGALMMIVGALVLTGWDKSLEAALVAISPAWLTDLTTRF